MLKNLIAAAAVALPLLDGRHFALSVGWMLIAGGTAEFMLGWSAHRSVLGKVMLGSRILTIFLAFGVTGTLLTASSASLSISFLVAGIGFAVIALSQRRTLKHLRMIGVL